MADGAREFFSQILFYFYNYRRLHLDVRMSQATDLHFVVVPT